MSKENIILSYTFDELAKEVQEKTLDRYRDFNVEYVDWSEFVLDYWKEKLEKIGFADAKIYFSGFSSQGDGACFEARMYHAQLLNSLIMCYDKAIALQAEKCLWLYENGLLLFSINRNSFASRYCHEKTAYLDIDNIYSNKVRDSTYWNTITDDIKGTLEELRLDLCKQIYRDLKTEYNYQTSDVAIKETFEANEYEFTIDGKIF
jgi:hypothetical protein